MPDIRIKTGELEITEPLNPIPLDGTYHEWYCLIRHRSVPIGWLRIRGLIGDNHIPVATLGEELIRQMPVRLIANYLGSTFKLAHPILPSPEGISVVVCTRNRAHFLETCLKALTVVDYPTFEIIVVDNAPDDDSTLSLVKKFAVRYVREDRAGLNWARNAGLVAAKYSIIAFTDDDACVDRYWLKAIGQAFRDSRVKAVSGFVAPKELDTTARQDFEFTYGGMSHGFDGKLIRREDCTRERLLWAGSLGVGVNMAFRRSVFAEVGTFDVALDAGTPTRGGGDIEMLFRVVMHNHHLIYLPDALVWHSHRPDKIGLKKQINDNGCSFACFLFTVIDKGYFSSSYVWSFIFKEWIVKRQLKNVLRPEKPGLRKLIWYEFKGMLSGRSSYRASQKNVLKIKNSTSRNTA